MSEMRGKPFMKKNPKCGGKPFMKKMSEMWGKPFMKILEMTTDSLLLIFLGIGAVIDYRKKEISLIFPAAGFCIGFILQTIIGNLKWYEQLSGCALGGLILLLGFLSKQAVGYGDGLMLIATGAFLGIFGNILLLISSLVLAGIFSAVLLILRKANRKKEIPFVPFMLGGFLLMKFLY